MAVKIESHDRWALGLMTAILAVVCPRQILFWVSGVGAVEVPRTVLLWADGLVGGATAIVMTGGQMYLVHHLTAMALSARSGTWRLPLLSLLAATWLLVIGVTIVIGSAHVVMQVSGEPLLTILQLDWLVGNLPTWLVGLTTVAALELTAAGLALAHADSLVHALDVEVRDVEASKDAVLMERNRLADQNVALGEQIERLEQRLADRDRDRSEAPPLVQVPCRHGCGWISRALPEDRARRSERAHVGHRHRKEDLE